MLSIRVSLTAMAQIMRGKDGTAATKRALKTVMETLQESFDPIIDLPVGLWWGVSSCVVCGWRRDLHSSLAGGYGLPAACVCAVT